MFELSIRWYLDALLLFFGIEMDRSNVHGFAVAVHLNKNAAFRTLILLPSDLASTRQNTETDNRTVHKAAFVK